MIPPFRIVDFSITGLCNRTCPFCPRSDSAVFPNRREYLPVPLFEKIVAELHSLGFTGRIVFSGFCEPFTHKRLADFVEMARGGCPRSEIVINTDGDYLKARTLHTLFLKGLSQLNVSVYDGPEALERFKLLRAQAGLKADQMVLRMRYLSKAEGYGFEHVSNRTGLVPESAGLPPVDLPVRRPCTYPFYLTMIDHKGDVLLCPHDWGKALVVGNVAESTLLELWRSPAIEQVRNRLWKGERLFRPCNTCSINGMTQGVAEMEAWAKESEAKSPVPPSGLGTKGRSTPCSSEAIA